ncbi:hypothetical protein ABB37_01355 [Leptomonas pyrrhocoris]|uniref:Uncharacterized protein n=1 Tax=Leptomonas pyrrhocoris TaxID=157538 RepID=A0A0M9G8L5_LEPPY|nr:hypothetical protein ABB37_01355 [Leptomonas pyrrhocoris]KPA84903.1 hypothetical protein ABB37_01355 [Leptomonas pyrrhocoris]|eukprot:XP_015663342.1 hypothetical protein ABB37_01355 [Leptomonas pyrrhocoris]
MPPVSNGGSDGSDPSRVEHALPCDAEELHDRTHRFLSTVGPSLDSIEALLESWRRFRAVSATTNGLPEKSAFRTVQIDPFSIRQPPPTVAEAEITQYIKKLSKKDLKALHDEYELTCSEDFEYVRVGEDDAENASQAAARIVHFPSEVADANTDEEGDPTKHPLPPSVSPITRARALFESEATSVEPLHIKPDGRMTEVRSSAPPIASSELPPAFSLEQMSPSAVADYERKRSTSSDSSYSGPRARSPTTADTTATENYTVEIEYEPNHFIPSAAQRALRDGVGRGIMITPAPHRAPKTDTPSQATKDSKMAPVLQTDSDAEADVQSFTTFSRIVLANEGRRLTSQRAKAEAWVGAESSPPARAVAYQENHRMEGEVDAGATPPRAARSAIPAAAAAPAAPARTVAVKVMKSTIPVSTRDVFVRRRVHDILLANRVRAEDAAVLGAAFFEKLDDAWNSAANQTTPVLQKLDELLRESSALLHMLEVMDHQVYRERVMDPAQYLCVPRYSAACAAPDCNAPFSTTVTRVMCGRCGQFFCPTCCGERGLGPDVVCEGQRYSLGWEPLCRLCFQMCRDSQQKLLEERNQYLRIAAVSSYHDAEGGDSEEDAARRASADGLTLKQAVLFGAYCDEQKCLSDGLPPFYVMDRTANEAVVFWDVLRYQFAKTQGSLRRGWQNAGSFATHAVKNAAQMVSRGRGTLKTS